MELFRVLGWQQPSFFQMPDYVCILGRVGIVRDHHNRLAEAFI
jgi:hypothetical protein